MSQGHLRVVVRHLRRLAGDGAGEPTDRELLERFAARRDEAAFAALMERHGPMVFGVCRRALRHRQDAEDAFQATFLVLARKAGSAGWRDSVHNWLYEVASRLVAEARVKAARRRRHEEQAGRERTEARPDHAGRELAALIDEELLRLPARFRTPLLLCYLEGLTSDQAARQLGWSLRTLQRRLAQGRDLLRQRLTRRGITLSAALLAPALAEGGVPALLTTTAVRAALAFVVGGAGATAQVTTLAKSALRGMTMTRLRHAAVALLVLGTIAGTGLVARHTWAAPAGAEERPAQVRAAPAAAKERDAPPAPAPAPFGDRLWAVMDLVREKHPEPPSRQAMLAAAAKALFAAAKTAAPDDLQDRVGRVKTREQCAALLKEVWPRGADVPATPELEQAALQGLFDAVPGRGVFTPPAEVRVLDQISGNRYVGTGIQIAIHADEKMPQIITPFRGGPARKAGIKPGELIVEVEGKSTRDVPLPKVVEWLRGEEGTTVTVAVRAPGAKEQRTVKMTRSVVPFDSLYGYKLAEEDVWDYRVDARAGIGYVRVDSCRVSTLHELRQVERRLRAQGARALVIDFRSGGGSEFSHGQLVADALLDGAPLWRLREAGGQVREVRSGRDCLFRDWPLAVLVNDHTDTVEGAIAAALQDNGRAVLVGEETLVGGFVNTLLPLPDGAGAVRFRTGRLERVGKDREWPVKPEQAVPLTKKQREAVDAWLIAKGRSYQPGSPEDKAPEDPQLDKAVGLLRAALKKKGEAR
jgi:C-terminal peptidase prc